MYRELNFYNYEQCIDHWWARVPGRGGGQKGVVYFDTVIFCENGVFKEKTRFLSYFFDFFYLKILIFSSISIDFLFTIFSIF